jgi:uncharacterized protein (DUF1499 family)
MRWYNNSKPSHLKGTGDTRKAQLQAQAASRGASDARPPDLGIKDGRFVACPSRINRVSSQAADEGRRIAPLTCTGPAGDAIKRSKR